MILHMTPSQDDTWLAYRLFTVCCALISLLLANHALRVAVVCQVHDRYKATKKDSGAWELRMCCSRTVALPFLLSANKLAVEGWAPPLRPPDMAGKTALEWATQPVETAMQLM